MGNKIITISREFGSGGRTIGKELAEKESCVIVGRCADYILKDHPDCLRVFIHADMESRAKRIVEQYGERDESPKKRLADKDKRRAAYYQFYTDMKWGEALNLPLYCFLGGISGNSLLQILKDCKRVLKWDAAT